MGENLGQHFLKDETVAEDMIDAANVTSDQTVIEIGPGKGILTKHLLDVGANVVAIEKDPSMITALEEQFDKAIPGNQLSLIEADIRDITTESVVNGDHYKIVANIPYYITSKILRQFLTAQHQPNSITMLTQKEVAERITNTDKESVLSLSVKVYGEPSMIRHVEASAFSPAPDVDSAILHIENISRSFFEGNNLDEEDFFTLIKAGFRHKRKTLANNLASAGLGKANAKNILDAVRGNSRIRAEKMSVHDWLHLHDLIHNQQ